MGRDKVRRRTFGLFGLLLSRTRAYTIYSLVFCLHCLHPLLIFSRSPLLSPPAFGIFPKFAFTHKSLPMSDLQGTVKE